MGILAHDFPFKPSVTSENYRVLQEQNLDLEEHEVAIFLQKIMQKHKTKKCEKRRDSFDYYWIDHFLTKSKVLPKLKHNNTRNNNQASTHICHEDHERLDNIWFSQRWQTENIDKSLYNWGHVTTAPLLLSPECTPHLWFNQIKSTLEKYIQE